MSETRREKCLYAAETVKALAFAYIDRGGTCGPEVDKVINLLRDLAEEDSPKRPDLRVVAVDETEQWDKGVLEEYGADRAWTLYVYHTDEDKPQKTLWWVGYSFEDANGCDLDVEEVNAEEDPYTYMFPEFLINQPSCPLPERYCSAEEWASRASDDQALNAIAQELRCNDFSINDLRKEAKQ